MKAEYDKLQAEYLKKHPNKERKRSISKRIMGRNKKNQEEESEDSPPKKVKLLIKGRWQAIEREERARQEKKGLIYSTL